MPPKTSRNNPMLATFKLSKGQFSIKSFNIMIWISSFRVALVIKVVTNLNDKNLVDGFGDKADSEDIICFVTSYFIQIYA